MVFSEELSRKKIEIFWFLTHFPTLRPAERLCVHTKDLPRAMSSKLVVILPSRPIFRLIFTLRHPRATMWSRDYFNGQRPWGHDFSTQFPKVTIVDLVTFHSNKYLTVEGVKIGSGIWKKVKWDLLNKPRMYFQYFVDLRKSVFSFIFIMFLRVFWCFTCKYWEFSVFFINMGHVQGPKNISSERN